MGRKPIMNEKVANNQMNKSRRLVYILRGKNRRGIYQLLLGGARTIGEISKELDIAITNASRTVKQLEKKNLLFNITPNEPVGCLYKLTPLALEIKSEFKKHMQFQKSILPKN